MIKTLSVQEYVDYSEDTPNTPQGVRWQIQKGLLPKGVTAKKIGKAYVITVKSN
jgi:hypothetical protein